MEGDYIEGTTCNIKKVSTHFIIVLVWELWYTYLCEKNSNTGMGNWQLIKSHLEFSDSAKSESEKGK
jgi:hypothetical protein